MPYRKIFLLPTLFGLVSILLLCVQACKGKSAPEKHKNELSAEDRQLWEKAKSIFALLPDTMPGSSADTPEQQELGRSLYFETALSVNNKQSCNSCHPLDKGFAGADHEVTGLGALGRHGDRNDPSTFNAGFQLAQFWDGRAATLEEQAKKPILNPVEMAMPSEQAVVVRLKNIPAYTEAFRKAFPGDSKPVNFDNLAKAIAAFERTLVSKGKIDRYLNGDPQALSHDEKNGLKTFIEVGCIQCHVGPNFGGMIYHKMGLFHEYENKTDLGRYAVTRREGDKYVFKVPMLRNVLLTAPYFHDGKAADVETAIQKMAYMQLDRQLQPADIQSIKNFLSTLSDEKIISSP